MLIGFWLGRRWFPRHRWSAGILNPLNLPQFIVRLEPVNVVLYAGDSRAEAKHWYHAPLPATAGEVQLFEAGKLRGRRRHHTERPVRTG